MPSWADEQQRNMREVGASHGLSNRQDFTWRRPHTLKSARAVPATLAVKVAALAGVSALTLYAGSGIALEGIAWEDLVITIAAVDYTLSADATVSSNELAVSFAPVLAAGVDVDDVVTVAGTVDKTLRTDGGPLWGNYEALSLEALDVGGFGSRGFAFRVPRNGIPLTPRRGHLIDIAALNLEGRVGAILDETPAMYQLGVVAG